MILHTSYKLDDEDELVLDSTSVTRFGLDKEGILQPEKLDPAQYLDHEGNLKNELFTKVEKLRAEHFLTEKQKEELKKTLEKNGARKR